jgi:hypothetical protein
VRRRRGRGERRLEDALEALGRALNALDVPWMLIGGLAVIARGVRRFTTDIDAVVQGDAVDLDALLRSLSRNNIVPRVPDAKVFATANLILLVIHEPSGVELDVSLGWTGFEQEALDARSPVAFGPLRIPTASAEDLIIFKIVAAREIDLQDATTLLILYPKIDLVRIRKRVRELAELMEEPVRIATLERLVRDVASHTGKKASHMGQKAPTARENAKRGTAKQRTKRTPKRRPK